MLQDILQAVLVVTALLLPWFAGYLALGIALGPVMLRALDRVYGVQVDYLRDTPMAIMGWLAVAARIFSYEFLESD